MLEIKDLEPLYEFVNNMIKKGYECDFKIDNPQTTTNYNYVDIENTKIIKDKIEQKIELKIYKYPSKKL